MRTIFLIFVLLALLLPVGCKKSADVATVDYTGSDYNRLSVSFSPQQVRSEGDAIVGIEVKNLYPFGSSARLTIICNVGYTTGNDGTIEERATVIYYAVRNATDYPIRGTLEAKISKIMGYSYVNRSATATFFILPEVATAKINFNEPFQYLDGQTGSIDTWAPEK